MTGIVFSGIFTTQGAILSAKSFSMNHSHYLACLATFPISNDSIAVADSTQESSVNKTSAPKREFSSKTEEAINNIASNVEDAIKVVSEKADKVIKEYETSIDSTKAQIANETQRVVKEISEKTEELIQDLESPKKQAYSLPSEKKRTPTTQKAFDRAMSLLYDEMEVKEGYAILKTESLRGDIRSQLFLSMYPDATNFSTLSPTLAQVYEGAENGNAQYQYLLGKSYLGADYIINIEKAIVWLQKAANSKEVAATRLLSRLTYHGIGVDKSVKKAFQLLTTAAKQKDTIALRMVADAYLYGQYQQKKDSKKAIPYLLPLAQSDHVTAQKELGKIYYSGKRSKSIVWYHKAADQGDLEATKVLADLYYEGTGVVKDYKRAKALYMEAASQGDVASQARLGDIYYYGKGVKRNYTTACSWYEKAMMQGATAPAEKLSRCYDKGWGVKRDPIYRDFILGKASKHYKLTQQEKDILGNRASLYSLGAKLDVDFSGETHYRIGREFEKKGNFKEAFRWNNEGAKLGFVTSHQVLGDYYIKGLGTKVNRDSALHHYVIAASLENKKAHSHLQSYNYKRVNPDIVKKDLDALTTTALQGNRRVAMFLSTCYDKDDLGVDYDQEKSSFWKKVANSQTKKLPLDQWSATQWNDISFITAQAYALNFKAQAVLGYWFLTGIDHKENLSEGMMWLQSAVKGGDRDAAYLLASIYHSGYKTILPNKEMYTVLIDKAYGATNPSMKLAAIQLKLSHRLTSTDIKEVISDIEPLIKKRQNSAERAWSQWLAKYPSEMTQAITTSYALRSEELLARIYFYGPYPINDPEKSMIYYQQAVNMQGVVAKINLGFGYEYQLIPHGKSTKALFYWRALRRDNDSLARPYLFRAYDQGIGTKKNKRFAKRYQSSSKSML
ncbi:hypothetical protein OAT16_11465 [Prolixibacteraceae bacterium]|nr:hypothetical protein [Prolixibacteraceae bacterium]